MIRFYCRNLPCTAFKETHNPSKVRPLDLDFHANSKDQKNNSWIFCSGLVIAYFIVGMYISVSMIFVGMNLFILIFESLFFV